MIPTIITITNVNLALNGGEAPGASAREPEPTREPLSLQTLRESEQGRHDGIRGVSTSQQLTIPTKLEELLVRSKWCEMVSRGDAHDGPAQSA